MGFPVVFQHRPFTVTGVPPSDKTLPVPKPDICVMFLIESVSTEGLLKTMPA
jgi:hypothetical protein